MTSTKSKQTFPYKNPAGIDLEVERLDKTGCEFLIIASALEEAGEHSVPDLNKPGAEKVAFPLKIIQDRISRFELPISFTGPGLLATLAYTMGNPGRTVALLVDVLNCYPAGTTITAEKMVDMYPDGTYTEEAFCKYVDEYLKPKKIPWSEIY